MQRHSLSHRFEDFAYAVHRTCPGRRSRWCAGPLVLMLALIGCAGRLPSMGLPDPGATRPLPDAAIVVTSTQVAQELSRLEPILAELYNAYRTGDGERLAALGGSPYIDLAANTVRVILEMDRDPEAHQAGPPVIEEVTLENGQKARIEHAPPIAIREELAQAIAATGATVETAYENLVQVLAPFSSLEALALIPDVRLVRLPWSAGY